MTANRSRPRSSDTSIGFPIRSAVSSRSSASTDGVGSPSSASTQSPARRPARAAALGSESDRISIAESLASPSSRARRRSIGRVRPASPSRARRTRPCWSSWLTTKSAVVAGIANPIPCANAMIAVLIPITAPLASSSGPPELPGFSGAVCWMTLSISRPCTLRSARPVAD